MLFSCAWLQCGNLKSIDTKIPGSCTYVMVRGEYNIETVKDKVEATVWRSFIEYRYKILVYLF